jgi:myosin heavy subunit
VKANLNLPDVSASQMALLGADLGQVDEAQDSKNFNTLLSAFALLGFSQQDVSFVFSVVAACLHLKELKFYESDQIAKVRAGVESFETACELLGVPLDKLKEAIMSKSIRVMGQTSSVQNLGMAACEASVMSVICTLYSSLFDWLLHRINAAIGAPPSVAVLSLGILDVAGFEAIKNNGFSQLCFNYGSEKMQELFIGKAMLEEMQLYRDEGLQDVKIDVNHNDPIIQFYEDKTFGIFAILDAQCRLPSGSDEGMLHVLLQNLSGSSAPSYISSRVYDRNPKSNTAFVVKHHAAHVNYSVTGMLSANKETHLRDDIIAALRLSKFENLQKMLPIVSSGAAASTGGPVKAAAKVVGSSLLFKDQITNLSQRLRASHCHFIRCFSPNTEENPEAFDGAFMLSQLRSSGIFEAVSLRMRGYPFRKNLDAFVKMYRALVTSQTHSTPKLMCRKIIGSVFGKGDDVHVGESIVRTPLPFQHAQHPPFDTILGFLQAFPPQNPRSGTAKGCFWSSAYNPTQFSRPRRPVLRSQAASSANCVHVDSAALARLEIGRAAAS